MGLGRRPVLEQPGEALLRARETRPRGEAAGEPHEGPGRRRGEDGRKAAAPLEDTADGDTGARTRRGDALERRARGVRSRPARGERRLGVEKGELVAAPRGEPLPKRPSRVA